MGSAFLHSSLVVWCAVSSGVALAQSARSAETDDPFVIGERQEIFSEILDETRQLIVGVPGDYDSNQEAYPVLYLLDGNSHFHHTTATADYLARNGRIPRTIVVAIPNTDRTRDLTPSAHSPEAAESFPTHGGADTFLRFISDELMPWMGEHYRTRSHATLIGHSFGGLFALHALVSRPDVFDAYVAISPSLQWDEQRLVKQADTMFARTPELTADLYMTVGNEGGTLLGGVRKFSGVLDEHAPRGFRWAFQLMEEETHGSVPLRSTQQGLEAVLAGWYLHDILSMFDRGGLTAIEEYYRRGGERFGYERAAPPTRYTLLTLQLIRSGRLDEAADVLRSDPESRPAPSGVLLKLADAYAERANDLQAREYYTLSLKANPANERAKNKLSEMGVDVAALIPEVTIAAETLASYVGSYRLTPAIVIDITLEDGQLTAAPTGLHKQRLAPPINICKVMRIKALS